MTHRLCILLILVTFTIAAVAVADSSAPADDSGSDALHLYTSARRISIPIDNDEVAAGEDGVRHAAVVLFVSGNRGQSWVRAQKRALPSESIEFKAANDGIFWCIIRGESINQRGPSPGRGAKPDIIVTVDTEKPELKELVVLPTRQGQPLDIIWQVESRSPLAAVEAAVVGDTPGAAALWPAPQITLDNIGRMRFAEALPGKWTINISFRDMSGNLLEVTRDVTVEAAPAASREDDRLLVPKEVAIIAPLGVNDPSINADSASSSESTKGNNVEERPATVEPNVATEPRNDELFAPPAEVFAQEVVPVLPTRTIQIDYTLEEGAARPDKMGLWVTTDGGNTWQLDQTDTQLSGAFRFIAAADGHYGFQIHQQRGRQVIGCPSSGQAPQREVIIDTSEPVIRWTAPLGSPAEKGKFAAVPARAAPPVELRWTIDEPNLADNGLKIEVRPFGQVVWQSVAEGLDNTGCYLWTPPHDLRGRVELRLSAIDRAGHTAAARLVLELLTAPLTPLPPATDRGQPDTADAIAADEARRAYEKARYARLQQRWDDAETQLLRSVSLDPDFGPAWSDLGGIYLRDNRLANAADAYTRATELLPDSINAMYGLARAQAARKEYDSAMKTLSALLEKSPSDADAWLLNGDVLWQSGQYDKAHQSWMKSLGLGGGSRGNIPALQKRLELPIPPQK